ncbi:MULTISPECIES: L-serine ammonia-lyase, iron-sulfur-dependent, subunit alpha [Hymenobacter]|uniref:L-serine dehydratase n=2 Tax=Hymenobacter TaxID=89966 RepID=A0ABS6WWF9_9BACT|nr:MULTISPECIES: L-serine ammonia-lyase, iron-sulfur-dependent, subunit alpha [Hymenobacter]MBO3272792.1 L-serine ammonia-lyase, iron-sulfur-dependent, subunit alpha [Hymenobacter defluvii]MBW3127930.1 L-serine ammonia-lyase, iron-sulfur-dependent, subunit alpha [Hymenobacter profundi]QNE41569.1 L-serine ammonia-lyase, iron-sulfur-dependent, subunit alpha [Hymenobacter sp. NBH84]
MSLLFTDFASWQAHCEATGEALFQPVLAYEIEQKGRAEADIWPGLQRAYDVMRDAVQTGLTQNMVSRSGMVNNGARKIAASPVTVLSPEFKQLVTRALGAKEVNSCMGRVVAAPTAGASGILPGVLVTLQEQHQLDDRKILEGLLVAAGIALIIEQNASLAGAVGGCQAETGSAAAMGSGAIVYCLGGSVDEVFAAVAITIQCMLGLVCDPVAGLVEVPCVVRNASAAAIAFSSAQIAIAGVDPVIPVDQCVAALGEVGQSMETRYKETALGGLANTTRGREIERMVLVQDVQILPDEEAG